MATSLLGLIDWSLKRDKDGHRTYTAAWKVQAAYDDGPLTILNTAGLPAIGSTWALGTDADAWAYCTPEATVTPLQKNEPNILWSVKRIFSTKNETQRCQTDSIESPLDEPDRLSGSFVKYTKEVTKNIDGTAMTNSSGEQLRGAIVEFDHNRPTVKIEKNLSSLPLSTFAPMIDTVNDASLWGLASRCVKLSNASWSRHLYGTCTYYYTVGYEFDIDDTTFDRDVIDEGSMILNPGGTAGNAQHYSRYKDANGENTRCLLNGAGAPLTDGANPFEFTIQHYEESDFTTLGLPASL